MRMTKGNLSKTDTFKPMTFPLFGFINKRRSRIIRFYCIGWTLAFIFLSIVRGVGTVELGNIQLSFEISLLIAFTMGPIVGLISGGAQILTEERIYKHVSIRRLLLINLLYFYLFIMVVVLISYGIFTLYLDLNINITSFAFDRGSFAIYFYVIVVDLLLAMLRQVNLMLGEGKLGELLRGKFYTPREEKRIFMFLDLQASTELAERLGHVNYSMLIQDCFNDLGIALKNEAEIYQYVGDEAVLTWNLSEGLKNENCLKAYYNFAALLQRNSDVYQKKYNCMPFFKAGLHSGVVTVTEVGKYKKEIAYHGDTINTAARIQGQCNALESELLISEKLKNELASTNFTYTAMGSIPLKGKKENVSIYAVQQGVLV
ncbi:adenylate/guanylate cyclase domain-containing protein [Flagellimonas sp. HMM57]|uniref:adenylate/guanylate cyclase domain-containing protein n=1 Tax=unclassified Flagellimonas TaxID=2644544 RepID=UPI0013D6CEAE|nr:MULTISPECIES: adenylate/guanylate cyclase domain-containing protein [unclassified Flagellimonas]UII74823.1 adenylate/guanylate cyclase domain-containing protein [Flagellimonas sp. HMM57]